MPGVRVLLASLLVAIALLAASTRAADCTSAQVAQVTSLSANATTACGSDALTSSATAATYCTSSCLAFLTSVSATAPNCDVSGYNVRTTLASAISLCDSQSDAVPAAKSSAYSSRPPSSLAVAALAVLSTVAAALPVS